MSAAPALLAEARRHGVRLQRDGDRLKLKAPTAPPAEFLDQLRNHKAEILCALAVASEPEPSWTADDWRSFFDERAGIAEFDGGLSRPEAEVIAYEGCLSHWQNIIRIDHADDHLCPCCGKQIDEGAAIPVLRPMGGHLWLHHGCHARWLLRRRAAAKATLAALGISPPAGWRAQP